MSIHVTKGRSTRFENKGWTFGFIKTDKRFHESFDEITNIFTVGELSSACPLTYKEETEILLDFRHFNFYTINFIGCLYTIRAGFLCVHGLVTVFCLG